MRPIWLVGQSEVELELADGANFSGIRDWAGKIVGQSIRIAALLELALRAEKGEELCGTAISKWALVLLMLTGRLELYSIIVLLSPAFWRR